jgi:hypothetical protein
MADAIAHQSRLETDAEALHLACCVKALLADEASLGVTMESLGTSSALTSIRIIASAADQELDPTASLCRQTRPSGAPEQWVALSRLNTAARTAETKERVLHSMGKFVVDLDGGRREDIAARFLETLKAGCNPTQAPSTRLASVRAMQASGVLSGILINPFTRLAPPIYCNTNGQNQDFCSPMSTSLTTRWITKLTFHACRSVTHQYSRDGPR